MRRLFLVCLVAWSACPVVGQELKLSDVEKSVVQIAVVKPDKTVVPCGTGFFVRDDGIVATAFHVYSQAVQIISEGRGGSLVIRRVVRTLGTGGTFTMGSAEVKTADASHDIILLKVLNLDHELWSKVGGTQSLSISAVTQVDVGVPIRVVGYFGVDSFPLTLRAALVGETAVVFPGNEVDEFIVSASAVPGQSGSPVILEDGTVLGVVLSIVPVTVPFSNQPVPSGLNRVAKAEFLQRLVSSLPK